MDQEVRTYEAVVILRHSLSDLEVEEFISSYTARIEQEGSTLIKLDNWGKRKLAYEIKSERKGIYLCFTFSGKGDLVRTLEDANRINDVILKYMTIRLEKASGDLPVTDGEKTSGDVPVTDGEKTSGDVPVTDGEVEEPESAIV